MSDEQLDQMIEAIDLSEEERFAIMDMILEGLYEGVEV